MELDHLLQLDDSAILYGTDRDGVRYLGVMLMHYSQVFGESCSGCAKKHPYYLQRLRRFFMEKKEFIKGEFELKKDAIIPIMGTSEVYSDRNLTDEAALKILKKNPNAIVLFTKKPENWEELVEAYQAGETIIKTLDDVAKLKVPAIRILFPDASGRSKEDLLHDIAAKYPELVGGVKIEKAETGAGENVETGAGENVETGE